MKDLKYGYKKVGKLRILCARFKLACKCFRKIMKTGYARDFDPPVEVKTVMYPTQDFLMRVTISDFDMYKCAAHDVRQMVMRQFQTEFAKHFEEIFEKFGDISYMDSPVTRNREYQLRFSFTIHPDIARRNTHAIDETFFTAPPYRY